MIQVNGIVPYNRIEFASVGGSLKIKIFVLLSILLSAIACTSVLAQSPYPLSDHYNGNTFFNPNGTKLKSFFTLLKWQLTKVQGPWPDHLELPPAPPLEPVLAEHEVSVTFINHSTFLIRTKHFNILTDPIWSKRASPLQWAGPKRVYTVPLELEDLPPIHFVLVSHNHYDHMDSESLVRLQEKFKPRVLLPLGDKSVVEGFGVKNAEELDWYEEVIVTADLKFVFAPCQHWSARGMFDRNKSLWGSWMILYKGQKIYFAGDTGYSSHFSEIHKKFGPADLALLPIGAYEPRWFMKEHHMNPAEAAQAHLDLQSRQSVGMHFGTFRLTDEAYEKPVQDLETALKDKKIAPSNFIVLKPGLSLRIGVR